MREQAPDGPGLAGELRTDFAESLYDEDRLREWLRQHRADGAARQKRRAAAIKGALERRWHTIYMLYDARDRLLYVGISANGPGRFPQHAKDKAWWRKVARCEFEHVKGRSAAEARELELILERNPRWNVRGKPAVHTGGGR